MNNRLVQAPEVSVQTTLDRLQADLRELRSRQSIDRTLVTRSTVVQSAAAFDLTADTIPANSFRIYRVNLLTSAAQTYPYAVLYMDVYNGGTGPGNLLSNRGLTDSNGVGYQWKPEPSNVPNRMDWSLSVTTGASGATIWMKFHALSTAPMDRVFISYS